MALKNILSWYYERKLSLNESKLVMLRNKKNELVDVIKKTETYAKAKEILSKFAPNEETELPHLSRTYSNPDLTSVPDTTRTNAGNSLSMPLMRDLYTKNRMQNTESTLLNNTLYGSKPQLVNQSPYPILSPTKSFFDSVISMLVGDGAKDRFALICKKCSSHNGMVLSEDFEYTAFRCGFCYTLNASRKQRPTGTKLEETNFLCGNTDDKKNKSKAVTPVAAAASAAARFSKNKNQTSDSDNSGNQQNCSDEDARNTKNNKSNQPVKDKS